MEVLFGYLLKIVVQVVDYIQGLAGEALGLEPGMIVSA